MLEASTISNLTIVLAIIVAIYVLKTNDEFPILPLLFFNSSGLQRYFLTAESKTWTIVAYSKGVNFFTMNIDYANQALNLFFLGTVLFILSYIFFATIIKSKAKIIDNQALFTKFFTTKKLIILRLFVIFLVVNSFTGVGMQYAAGAGASIASGMSYFLFFQFAVGGLILLMYLSFKSMTFKKQGLAKLVFALIILYAATISYNPQARFQFLSWIIALGVIIVKDKPISQKLRYAVVFGPPVLLTFSIAGLARTPGALEKPFEEQIEIAIERLTSAEDQNMLDGFMMVLQVYPYHLDYQYGFQHFEILLRPIPRLLWAGKPVGGYANKLGLNENMGGQTVGISETIYGTFYGEAGITGVVIFSILYGYIFVKLFRRGEKYNSDMRYLLKGMVFAFLLPLLRGGDLAGIVAFAGMSYWPVFIFLRQYNGFLRKEKRKQQTKIIQQQTSQQVQLATP